MVSIVGSRDVRASAGALCVHGVCKENLCIFQHNDTICLALIWEVRRHVHTHTAHNQSVMYYHYSFVWIIIMIIILSYGNSK